MSVRAKMHSQGWWDRGKVGAVIYLSAVCEGDGRLQKVSENAIFGDATPTGSLELSGDVPKEKFTNGEHYYVDLTDPAETMVIDEDAIVRLPVRKVYQQAFNANVPTNPITFRYAIVTPDTAGMLNLAIANPHAIGWLDGLDNLRMIVKLARGRVSDAEIEVRQTLLDEHLAKKATGFAGHYFKDRLDLAEASEKRLRADLAKAKGEI